MYLMYISFCVFFTVLLIFIWNVIDFSKKWLDKKLIYEHLLELLTIVEEAKELAYEKIYQDEIIVHVASGYRTNLEDMRSLQSNFVRLVTEFLGPNLMNDLRIIYGTDEAIFSLLVTYFNNRVTKDESKIFSSVANNNLISTEENDTGDN